MLAIFGILTIPVYVGVVVLLGVGISLRRTYPAPGVDRSRLRTAVRGERARQAEISGRYSRMMTPDYDRETDAMPGLAQMASSKNASPLSKFLLGELALKVAHGLARCTWFPIRDLMRELRR